ncbi:MAG: XRE family transcriptional regulator [Thermodesulfobacteriota bacterium]
MDIEKFIGKKIREIRKSKPMTISQLSLVTKLSEAQLSRIETGKSSAPVSTLDVIAKALGTKVGFLFEMEAVKEDPKIVLTRRDQRISTRKGMKEFGYNYEALVGKKHNKLMDPYLLQIDKKEMDKSVVFNHTGEEFIYILKGKMLFIYDDQKYYVEEGDSIYFDASVNHISRTIGDSNCEVLIVLCSP